MTRRVRPGLCFAVRADRIIAAAQSVRTSWRATKPGRRFASQAGHGWPAYFRRAPYLERDSRSPAVKLGRIAVREAKFDLSEGIAAAGPSGQRIGPWNPARAEAQPPQSGMRAARLVYTKGHRLDNRPCIGRQHAGAMADRCTIIICRRGGRRAPVARPGTEVPDLPVTPPVH
ncbi:hypothetical protein SC1_03641 [Sphingopyxis sp. C-1]|nr:hypothetical protein SC1_03641 [Sphingopyxis sp. C-1]